MNVALVMVMIPLVTGQVVGPAGVRPSTPPIVVPNNGFGGVGTRPIDLGNSLKPSLEGSIGRTPNLSIDGTSNGAGFRPDATVATREDTAGSLDGTKTVVVPPPPYEVHEAPPDGGGDDEDDETKVKSSPSESNLPKWIAWIVVGALMLWGFSRSGET